jgi:hypothetical protein
VVPEGNHYRQQKRREKFRGVFVFATWNHHGIKKNQ